ncbi:hypothetical protein BpHYR1_052098 [Brachionus plicatilis]|uniref:Uncharacterized protein n=1 Tax=Brachionus plicatilis TaxID=10195 RepID=A0A3M7RPF1_BRAPC|nr:hypothetical protein BpHYR1_052098 [Brachionus plicatilis]
MSQLRNLFFEVNGKSIFGSFMVSDTHLTDKKFVMDQERITRTKKFIQLNAMRFLDLKEISNKYHNLAIESHDLEQFGMAKIFYVALALRKHRAEKRDIAVRKCLGMEFSQIYEITSLLGHIKRKLSQHVVHDKFKLNCTNCHPKAVDPKPSFTKGDTSAFIGIYYARRVLCQNVLFKAMWSRIYEARFFSITEKMRYMMYLNLTYDGQYPFHPHGLHVCLSISSVQINKKIILFNYTNYLM